MTEEQLTLQQVRETIARMAPADQEKVEVAAQAMRALVAVAFPGGHGHLALALVGTEFTAGAAP